jgi:DNA polymerase
MLSRDDVFNELGIGPVWRLRETAPGQIAAAAYTWDTLTEAVARCTACKLSATRTQGVLGVGDRNADWLVIGEAPGADEDAQGEPFVGQAGKLLDAMLASIGLARGDNVYITNVVKSRPPGNRNPEPDEIAACMPYLLAQIELIRPKLILALGRVAAQSLLDTDEAIGRLRGQVHRFRDVPVVVTYHPAYLLRNLPDKARAWEDLCFARHTMQSLA